MYLIHWPVSLRKGASHPIPKEEDFLPFRYQLSVWRGLEQCVELGLTKSIGVSNFSCKKIEDLLTYANIPPAVNQVIFLVLLDTEMNEIHLFNSWYNRIFIFLRVIGPSGASHKPVCFCRQTNQWRVTMCTCFQGIGTLTGNLKCHRPRLWTITR